MNTSNNYEHNLLRLIDASPFTGDLSKEVLGGIKNYMLDCNHTLKYINIDDLIVNSLTSIKKSEYKDIEEYEQLKDDHFVIYESDDVIWYLQ